MFSRHLIAIPALVLLAGCQTPLPQAGSADAGFGEAVKYDMALQTIDPDPVYPPGSAEPGTSGTTNADAAKRYRTGTVKPVEVTTTSASGASVSSGPK